MEEDHSWITHNCNHSNMSQHSITFSFGTGTGGNAGRCWKAPAPARPWWKRGTRGPLEVMLTKIGIYWRLLPFIIGDFIPEAEPAWLVLLDVWEIVELSVAAVHNQETVAYLNCKIADHRLTFLLFPERLLPLYWTLPSNDSVFWSFSGAMDHEVSS